MNEIEKLRNLVQIQCSDGNWNYDHYMHGMANGMILALSVLENSIPKFLEAPRQWLAARKTPQIIDEAPADLDYAALERSIAATSGTRFFCSTPKKPDSVYFSVRPADPVESPKARMAEDILNYAMKSLDPSAILSMLDLRDLDLESVWSHPAPDEKPGTSDAGLPGEVPPPTLKAEIRTMCQCQPTVIFAKLGECKLCGRGYRWTTDGRWERDPERDVAPVDKSTGASVGDVSPTSGYQSPFDGAGLLAGWAVDWMNRIILDLGLTKAQCCDALSRWHLDPSSLGPGMVYRAIIPLSNSYVDLFLPPEMGGHRESPRWRTVLP